MKSSNHYLEGTREISTTGEYIPEYRSRYFMLWNADLPKGLEYNQVYEKKTNGKIIKRVYIPLIGYEKEEDQPVIYRNAMRRARFLLGLLRI